jgi:glycosyltransferase involved in cell wall biosynthesis
MDISVVIPVYNEVEALPELYRVLTDTLDRLPQSAEVVSADDGSKDGSAAALDSIAEGDPRVRVLHLSRNYGQTAALMAAIRNSTGAVIIPMDGDGQNDPADTRGFSPSSPRATTSSPAGARRGRTDALTRRRPSVITNRLISALLHVPLHDYGCTLKAYRREVVEDVRLYGEMHRFIPIYAAWGARHRARRRPPPAPLRPLEIRDQPRRAPLARSVDCLFHRPRVRPADSVLRQARPGFLVLSVAIFGWALALNMAGTSR